MSLMLRPSVEQADAARAYLRSALQSVADLGRLNIQGTAKNVTSVGIVGAGTMGVGIAMACLDNGLSVTLLDQNPQALERGVERIRQTYLSQLQRKRITEEQLLARMDALRVGADWVLLCDCDLVIESVFEDLDLKKSIFQKIDQMAKPGAVLATNTSGLDINAIASVTTRPESVVGAHFFSPAHVQKLLEVIKAENTSHDVLATLIGLSQRIGKIPVLSEVYPGFIGNAVFRQCTREAHFLVEEGAFPHEVDQALTDFGYAMGVFAVHDLAGNDVGYQTHKKEIATRPADRRWNDVILDLCDLGRLGQKSGLGWYRYDPGDRNPHIDMAVNDFLVARSEAMGIARRNIGTEEILKRCLLSMVNEGAKLLEKGVARRPSDIDLAFTLGYGYPKDRGGPMYFADVLGIEYVHAQVVTLYETHGHWWTPSPLLSEMAKSGQRFRDWD